MYDDGGDATSDADAAQRLEDLAESAELKALGQREASAEVSELANISRGAEATPSGAGKHKQV